MNSKTEEQEMEEGNAQYEAEEYEANQAYCDEAEDAEREMFGNDAADYGLEDVGCK